MEIYGNDNCGVRTLQWKQERSPSLRNLAESELPRDTLAVISLWPHAELANRTTDELFKSIRTIASIEKDFMVPTVR